MTSPESHDVRAHLHGGVPVNEIEDLWDYFENYSNGNGFSPLLDEVEKKKDELVCAARAKISENEAKVLILVRSKRLLTERQLFTLIPAGLYRRD